MEASLRAPFIVRWPGKVPAGRVNNEIVHIVDLYPTLARIVRPRSSRRAKIAGLCFLNERVDDIQVDSVSMPRPVTSWPKDWAEKKAGVSDQRGPVARP